MQPAEDMTAISKIDAHPIFSFADGEMGPLANSFIRAMEKVTGQPKIKKIYFDYVDDERPRELFWSDALERLNITYNLTREAAIDIPETGRRLGSDRPDAQGRYLGRGPRAGIGGGNAARLHPLAAALQHLLALRAGSLVQRGRAAALSRRSLLFPLR